MKKLLMIIWLFSAGLVLAETEGNKNYFKLTKQGFLFCENDYLKQNYDIGNIRARLLIQAIGKDRLRVLIVWRNPNKTAIGDVFEVKRNSSKVHVLKNITGKQNLVLELDELKVHESYEAEGVLKTQGWLTLSGKNGVWPLRCTKKVKNIDVSVFKAKYF